MNSSYTHNRFDEVFHTLVSAFAPKVCIELGVLEGYSSIAIAKGLKENIERGRGNGMLDSYDLFEDYPYQHSSREVVEKNLKEAGVDHLVRLHKLDAYEAHELYQNGEVDFMHVDLSNTGETVWKIMERWDSKMQMGGIIAFEGGSTDRDNVEWMLKYNAVPIKHELETNKIIVEKYVMATYLGFPSLTTLLKKR